MVDCSKVPTTQLIEDAGTNMKVFNEIITSDQLVTPSLGSDSKQKETLAGYTKRVNDLIQSGEIDYIGEWQSGVTEFTAYNQVAGYNGLNVRPLSTTTLPYTAQTTDPTSSPDSDNVYVFSVSNWGSIQNADLYAVARANNTTVDDVAYLETQTLTGQSYFYDQASQKTYVSSESLSGELTAISTEDFKGDIALTIDTVDYEVTRIDFAEYRKSGDVRGWGAKGLGPTGGYDDSQSYQAAVTYLKANGGGRLDCSNPVISWHFESLQYFKSPQLTAVSFCISLDGCQNIHLDGGKSTVTFGGDLADDGHIWLGIYTSDESVLVGNYSKDIKVTGFKPVGNRPSGVTKWQTFALVASTDGFVIEDVHLVEGWGDTADGSSIIQGDNVQRFRMRNCSGFGLTTPFDIANWEDVDIDDVLFDSVSAGTGVTGFNLFYAPQVYDATNLERAYREGYGSNVELGENAVFRGFNNGVRIEAQKDTKIKCILDSNNSNGLSVTTSATAAGLGYYTTGIYVSDANIFNNTTNGILIQDSADISNVRVTKNSIYDNGRGILGGNQIVNYYEFDNDFTSRDGAISQSPNGAEGTVSITTGNPGSESVEVSVESPATNASMSIKAKGTGKLSLGDDDTLKFNVTRSVITTEALDGYIEVYDKNNILRKLAIVS